LLALSVVAATLGDARADNRSLWLYNTHTKEEIRIRPFSRHGIPDRSSWARLSRFFRSWRTEKRRTIHPRLLRVLAQVQRHFGGSRIDLVSGYRVPERGDDLRSYHNVGRAADVRVDGVLARRLFDYCRTLVDVGCGYYPRSERVHIDSRSRSTIWIDLSADGDAADYVRDPDAWLQLNP